jgi:hypothetical protein
VKHFHDAVQKQYGHPHQQYLDPVILRRALPNWEEAEATLRAGGAEGSTLADKLRLALDDAPLNLFIRRMNETWYALNMDIKKWYRAHEDYDKEHHDALIKQLYAVADSMMNFAGDLQAAPNNDAPTESDPTPTKH